MNQLANIRISQKTENGTLANYGMQFYNSTITTDGGGTWTPAGYEPGPFNFFPIPGNPNEILKRVDIPELNDVFEEIRTSGFARVTSPLRTTPPTSCA